MHQLKIIYITVVAFIATTNFALAQCACCAGASAGVFNGDFSTVLLTSPKNQWSAEVSGDLRTIRVDEDNHHAPAADEGEEEETPLKSLFISSFGVRYGITDNVTVSALLPYIFLNTDKGNDKGVGDLVVLTTFNVYNKNNFNVALNAGVELPTGVQKGANFDNTTVVVGSGSYDPLAGLAAKKGWDKFAVQASALYRHTTMGFDNTIFPSASTQNLTLLYKVKGENLFCSTDTVISPANKFSCVVFGGYYGEWLSQIEEKDGIDPNTGYYIGFASIGTSLSFKKWSVPLTLSLPVIQHLNGNQNDAGIRVKLGITKTI